MQMNGRTMGAQSGNGEMVGYGESVSELTGYAPLIWGSGPYQFCTFFNRQWLRFTGEPLMREVHEGWYGEPHPDDISQCLHAQLRAFMQRQEFCVEYRVRDWSGGYRWIRDKGTPSFGADGKFVGYMGSCIDITKQRELEDEL